jgi:hypothetical protein
MTPAGEVTFLYQFDQVHGADPVSPLVQGTDGNSYGTTAAGGDAKGDGVIFKLTPPAPHLGYHRDPRDFALVVGSHVGPDAASRSMCSTENSIPEIADLGRAASPHATTNIPGPGILSVKPPLPVQIPNISL